MPLRLQSPALCRIVFTACAVAGDSPLPLAVRRVLALRLSTEKGWEPVPETMPLVWRLVDEWYEAQRTRRR